MPRTLMSRRMTPAEFEANLKIQRLKEAVDKAKELTENPAALRRYHTTDLALLIANVNRSVQRRIGLQALGEDTGHTHWITVEQGYLQELRTESARRASWDKEGENKKLAGKPLLPPTARWGTRPPS